MIAYYPNSPFEIGEILHKTVHTYDGIRHCIPIGEVEKCPAIFKELQWWEKRDISELPEYVKSKHNEGFVVKVKEWSFYRNDLCFYGVKSIFVYYPDIFLPCTKADYLNYINQNKTSKI